MFDLSQLSPDEIAQLEGWENFFSYQWTDVARFFLNSRSKTICLFTGNQFGKNAVVAYSYVLRVLGRHPVKEKNIFPDTKVRTIRFASETLPSDQDSGEVRNTQYPEFKKWLPKSLIKKDISTRRPAMTLHCPFGSRKDIIIEFVSYGQTVQAQAGVQRFSVWSDENCGQAFYEEQRPRLLAANGDFVMTYTPTPGSSGWEFDDLYENAREVWRSDYVLSRIWKRTGIKLPRVEEREGAKDITVVMAATDDNPTLDRQSIRNTYSAFNDPDIIDARRYGLFRQLSGKVFKQFDPKIHVVSREKYFPDGLPYEYKHFRGVDYHQVTPWGCVWLAASPQDEIFVYDELNPNPTKMVTLEIANLMALKSQDYRFDVNLIDPLAEIKQTNTGLSVIQDMNRAFQVYRQEGLCTGGYWKAWDTKSTAGRDEFIKRIKNSALVGRPFANEKNGQRLPTIWFLDTCRETITSMKNWRYEEWKDRDVMVEKEDKEKPIQRWSHFPIAIECLLKDPMVSRSRWGQRTHREPKRYYGRA